VVIYHFKYETEELSQEFDNFNTAVCFAIMDKDNDTGGFVKITNELGKLILNTVQFEEIYMDVTVTITSWNMQND